VTEPPLVVDGHPITFEAGDSVALAVLRTGEVPGRGGTLCLAGDCGNCLATADGIAYIRTCQSPARPGLVVERHPADGLPPLPEVRSREVPVERRVVDVVVIGGGASGRAAEADARARGPDPEVLLLDSADGNDVVAIYAGPTVVARTPTGMLHVHADEIVVATGAAEIQPAVPGNDLAGLLTARAAERLHAAGVDLGRAVAIGAPPLDVPCERVAGDLVRFLGDDRGRVRAVVTADLRSGIETETPCDTAIIGLGLSPRDTLARMAASGADGTGGAATAVRIVGSAAEDPSLPGAPTDQTAVVCRCMGVTVEDLDGAWQAGYHELELLKRATLAGIGTCQGGACLPHVRAWIAERSGTVPQPFTARPASRQITIGEAAADVYIDAFRRTPLHDEHVALGARMDRFGGWWRPWHYGDALAEYWSVRTGVSIGDVSTLGKLVVSGPDVVEFLERLYPCHVADIKPGRSRYALLLNERGHVMDDGMILRESDTRFVLSFTSGGAANAEMWIRDWIDAWGLRVHVLDRTMSLAAINVTGPLAGELLRRAGLEDPPRFLGHAHAAVAGVPCHVMRLSFTGEAAWELHHPVDRSVELWRALMELGQDLDIRPHGLQALFALRLEKGHVIVGMDTELDTTPARLGMDWAVRIDKPRFIGRAALERTAKLPDHRRLVGFTMDAPAEGADASDGGGDAPVEGSPIFDGDDIIGHVTGSWNSPVLGRVVMLGWQKRSPLVDRVTIDGRPALVASTPFYDPEGQRARA
jgi:glycine cleavage system aminomethyltransferase T